MVELGYVVMACLGIVLSISVCILLIVLVNNIFPNNTKDTERSEWVTKDGKRKLRIYNENGNSILFSMHDFDDGYTVEMDFDNPKNIELLNQKIQECERSKAIP